MSDTNVSPKPANYDESKVPLYTLPSPLLKDDGTKITTAAEWETSQRSRIMDVVKKHLYGELPAVPARTTYQILLHLL